MFCTNLHKVCKMCIYYIVRCDTHCRTFFFACIC
nr:MAG TPA: hypothetical protein [Caudoviricetes sp.]